MPPENVIFDDNAEASPITSSNVIQQKKHVSELRKHRTIGAIGYLERLWDSFSLFERALGFVAFAGLIVSTAIMLKVLNVEITTEVPIRGGSFTEGMVGSPRFINPVLAVSDTDRTLTSLVFSGLLRVTAEGTIIPDLANGYEISEDGKTYTFSIRPDALFHDGTPVTSDDVAFTIQMAKDPIIKGPHRAEWEGVTVHTPDTHTVVMQLEKAYAPFIYNATLGIIPKHVWVNLTHEEIPFSKVNISAIGSGPYAFESVSYDAGGIPKSYALRAFPRFALGEPYVTNLYITFFNNTQDLIAAGARGSVDSYGGISAEEYSSILTESQKAQTFTLPRVFAVFFNQFKNTKLADVHVREALSRSIDKIEVTQTVLHGFAIPLDGPLPTHTTPFVNSLDFSKAREEAIAELAKAGWEKDERTQILTKDKEELSITLATANTEELKTATRLVAERWRSLGVRVKVEFYDPGDLNQLIVRPRAFDALLFGQVIGRDGDVFAFWHSSQREDPGLNITQYSEKTVDQMLEKARTVTDPEDRTLLFEKLRRQLLKDVPAAFLYVPEYMYRAPAHVQHVTLPENAESFERFNSIYTWYIDSTRVWNFFI
jgi:peptide/nickel transport system substrate-binding protein